MVKEISTSQNRANESAHAQEKPLENVFPAPVQEPVAERQQTRASNPRTPPKRPYSPPLPVNPMSYVPPGEVFAGAAVGGAVAGGIAGPPAFAIVGQATPHFQHPSQYPFWGDASHESGSITGLRAGVGVAGALGGEMAGVIGGGIAAPVLVGTAAAAVYTGAQAVNGCHFIGTKVADGVNYLRQPKKSSDEDIEMT